MSTVPVPSWALTGGPSQPEVQRFQPLETAQLVDPFTGDFSYTIPLMTVGDYPLTLSYSSLISMDQEASFVGLGWNLNPGAINRKVQGLPDDFAGDRVRKDEHRKDNITHTGSLGADLEVFGFGTFPLNLNVGVSGNNYQGLGLDLNFSTAVGSGEGAKPALTAGLGLSSNNNASLSSSVSLSGKEQTAAGTASFGGSIGVSLSSNRGLNATLMTSFDMNWANAGLHGGATGNFPLSFASRTFTPEITMPMENFSFSVGLRIGGEIFGTTGQIEGSYGYSEQRLARTRYELPAYGYMYSQAAGDARQVLHDFNREKDGAFRPTQPNLPVTQFTYDLYAVNAEGIGGHFRPFRSDVGMLFDPEVAMGQFEGPSQIDLELGGGNAVKVGVDLGLNHVTTRSGLWSSGNALLGVLGFADRPADPLYEQVFFKAAGEKTAMAAREEALFSRLGAFDPVRAALNGHTANGSLVRGADAESPLPLDAAQPLLLPRRQPRNLHFSFLTAKDAVHMALERRIRSYRGLWPQVAAGPDMSGYEPVSYEDPVDRVDARVDGDRKPHHLSEITVTRDDGTRYVFGLPAYNLTQEEVSFNASGLPTDASRTLATYTIGTHDSTGNDRGDNEYFSRVTTPAHAYAWYLTAVISPDYVDVTGDGPTPDDLGTYTKFNYRRHNQQYSWRTPATTRTADGTGKAVLNEAHLSDPADNVASYIYGKKEIWYLHSVESRNFVAELNLSPRDDALPATDSGGWDPATPAEPALRLQKLDSIKLFNKAERLAEREAGGQPAVPLQMVHFEYDYSLCRGLPNSLEGGGKLTLRKVSFSFRDSQKKMLSPYEFEYGSNPGYDREAVDRWGTFKPQSGAPPNRRFPYTSQATQSAAGEDLREAANINARAWHLTRIELPSGGALSVVYEADDYAYVQSRRPMQMVPIVATGAGVGQYGCSRERAPDVRPDEPYPIYDGDTNFVCFFFQLNEPLMAAQTQELAEYVRGLTRVYVNADVDVGPGLFESVSEFFTLLPGPNGLPAHGFDESGSGEPYSWGWIRVEEADFYNPHGAPAELCGDTIHPLALAAWQHIRLNLPKIAFGEEPGGDFLAELPGLWDGLRRLWEGFNCAMRQDGVANRLFSSASRHPSERPTISFLRLNHPTKFKIGGGSRVRTLILDDQWQTMAGPQARSHLYEEEYTYTTTDAIGDRTISSGVASYEPLVGGDESPYVQPIRYRHEGDRLFMLEPFGESFFPAPIVGYSRVTVRTVRPPPPEVIGRGTGHRVFEYYTAKDFPVRVARTHLPRAWQRDPRVSIQIPLLPSTSEDLLTASQGYSIELNDMHGKPKATWTYGETGDEPIGGSRYVYLTEPSDPARLANRVTTLERVGTRLVKQDHYVGIDYDVIADARENYYKVTGAQVQLNVGLFIAGIFPIIWPGAPPALSSEEIRFRSMVITKVIHRSALLSEVQAYSEGASLTTSNEAWDAETGQVLVTKAQNEFGTHTYSTGVPAHLEYEGMAGAWRNQGLRFSDVRVDAGGVPAIPDAASYFFPGDELLMQPRYELLRDPLFDPPGPRRAWVWKVTPLAPL
jgi:hypothetical protein